MNVSTNPTTVLVTGASAGLGLAIARGLVPVRSDRGRFDRRHCPLRLVDQSGASQ